MKHFLALLLFLALQAHALGFIPSQSVFGVDTHDGKGSCTYIGSGLFVTCHHVIEGHHGIVAVVDYDRGLAYPCKVAATSELGDVAVLRSLCVVYAPPAQVAAEDARIGERVTGCGFGESYHDEDPGSHRRTWSGAVVGTGRLKGRSEDTIYLFEGAAVSGDSGGGAFNSKGELIGPVSMTDNTNTYAVCNRTLRELLLQVKNDSER